MFLCKAYTYLTYLYKVHVMRITEMNVYVLNASDAAAEMRPEIQ